MKEILYSLEELYEAVEFLYASLHQYPIMSFVGTLGAGKTTLIRALLRRCGINGVITSPTFTYMNVYHNAAGQTFYHFDCYRIETLDEFMAAGFDEYLHMPNSFVFIEWPEVIMPLLKDKAALITLDYYDDKRKLVFEQIKK